MSFKHKLFTSRPPASYLYKEEALKRIQKSEVRYKSFKYLSDPKKFYLSVNVFIFSQQIFHGDINDEKKLYYPSKLGTLLKLIKVNYGRPSYIKYPPVYRLSNCIFNLS